MKNFEQFSTPGANEEFSTCRMSLDQFVHIKQLSKCNKLHAFSTCLRLSTSLNFLSYSAPGYYLLNKLLLTLLVLDGTHLLFLRHIEEKMIRSQFSSVCLYYM